MPPKDQPRPTFVSDPVRTNESEELEDVILVGHSFGGVPITGVADRIPERIAHLVYFDSIVLESGKDSFSNYPEEAEALIAAAGKATNGLAVPVYLRNSIGNGLPKTYIHCTEPSHPVLESSGELYSCTAFTAPPP